MQRHDVIAHPRELVLVSDANGRIAAKRFKACGGDVIAKAAMIDYSVRQR
jgi:hypothetical protein